MDDITGKISQLLSDPQAMEQIMSLTSLFSPSNEETQAPKNEPAKPALPSFSDDTMKTVMKIMPFLSNALRPFLCEERRKKLDEAEKILQLIKILPVIKQLNF